MRNFKIFFFLCISTLFSACDNESGIEKVEFDREAFLVNMADEVIQPSINDFATKATGLSSASLAFEQAQTESTLLEFRNSLKASWLSYQHLAFVQVVPNVNLRDRVNIFPASVNKIEDNITAGSYVLGAASNIDAKGFPALDYLLFGTADTETQIIEYFQDENPGNARVQYIAALVTDIQTTANLMQEGWEEYKTVFLGNTGTDVGSGTSILVNEFNIQFDIRLKNAKIGFPAGGNPRTGGVLSPEKVEAFYSGWSAEMAEATVIASLAVFKGESYQSGENGLGMDDYLTALSAVDRNGEDLSTAIISQINAAFEEMQKIDAPYSEVAKIEESQLVAVYNALQKVIPLIKVDMSSAMSVSITFQDNDGD
jgi:hypothetical protein